jgi:hypothetical protein
MKKILLIFFLSVIGWASLLAQLPNGTVAPDFTVTDLNGQTHNLYDLLEDGKTVYLDFSATWCGPCWNYHNTHALRDVWEQYGPPGTDQAFVIFIESDANTNTACLYGPSGCVGGTQGNWVNGTPYPIVDDASIKGMYAVSYYPTIYMICPADKKVYLAGQQPAAGLWNLRSQRCVAPVLQVTVNSVQNVKCFNTNTGRIDISVAGGNAPYTYTWSNGATTQDLINIPAGTYACSITSSNGWIGETGPIEVEGPSGPLSTQIAETTPVGCNGILGTITAAAQGGWESGYTYQWSNGQQGETAYSLQAGNYTVTITDAGGCSQTLSRSLPPAVMPIATATTPGPINCTFPTRTLNGAGSSNGPEFAFQWFASNGGNIVSGDKTLNPVVNAGGNYSLRVTNTESTCQTFFILTQPADLALPSAEAGPSGFLTCIDTVETLQGEASAGPNFLYDWAPINGGHIVSGDSTLHPVVDASGGYVLVVFNTTNGCVRTDTTIVSGLNRPPSMSVVNDPLTCDTPIVKLNTSTNAGNPVFAWTGPNNFSSDKRNPEVEIAGDYILIINDTLTFCINTDTFTVKEDKEGPGVLATGGDLTCIVQSVTLNAVAQDSLVSYAWNGSNGFESTEQNPTVNAAGDYTVIITAADNGCTSTATVAVNLATTPPAATAVTPGSLNCNNADLLLDGSASEQGAHISYAWSSVNGNVVSGENTQNPLINAAGDYTILVTNNQTGCTNTASVSVVRHDNVSASISSQNGILCFGDQTGSADATAEGGNGNYTYLWNNGSTESGIQNLTAGTYSVVVTDGEGCSAVTEVVINQPGEIIILAGATGQSASGVNDGTASALVQGGVPGYSYAWSNGETTADISALAPGTYVVTATDQNGCTKTQSITVNSYDCLIAATLQPSNVACAGASTGSIALTLTGGVGPFTYQWSNGATTENLDNIPAGTYGVTIQDDAGCEATQIATITQPAPLAVSVLTVESATCENDTDGAVSATIQGGVGAYTYLWSNGAQSSSISNLSPGVYVLTVTDENNCTVTQSAAVQAVDDVAPQITGGANAVVSIAANGIGTVNLAALNITSTDNCAGPVSVQFTPVSFSCQDLGKRTVQLVATDQSGNSASMNVEVDVVDQIAPTLTCPPNKVVCPADNTVTYASPVATDNCLGNGNFALLNGLSSGSEFPVGVTTQTYTYTDGSGNVGSCSFDVEVTQPAEVQVDEVIDDVNGQGIGAISVSVSGVAPFTYTWVLNGVVVGNTEDLTNLAGGVYELKITDERGCEFAGVIVEVNNVSGTQEPAWMQGVQIRPNPANDVVQVRFTSTLPTDLQLSLVDATGRVLLEQHFANQTQATLQTAHLPEGMYFLKIRSGAETGMRKVMIRH